MTSVTIIGTGTMGAAIAQIAAAAGATIQTIDRQTADPISGDIVVLAVPYVAIDEVIERYGSQLDGRIVVDVSNPRDPVTGELLLPDDTSAAEQLAQKLPGSKVVKAFNTTPAEMLTAPADQGRAIEVLVAGDDRLAKQKIMRLSDVAGVKVLDDGPLSRARVLEREEFGKRVRGTAEPDQRLAGP